MTKPDTEATEESFSNKKYWVKLIGWSVLLSLALIGGLLVGVASINLFEGEWDQSDIWFAAIGAPLTLIAFYFLWKWFPDFTMGEPDTPRARRLHWLVLISGTIGGLSTVPLIDTAQGGSLLFGNGPVPPTRAFLALLMWAVCMPLVIVGYRYNLDEVMREANNFGFSVGFQFFACLAPIWWMAWRGGFLPQPDIMIALVASLVVALLANLWKRF